MSDTIRFYTNDLCSKWGFDDGDMMAYFLEDKMPHMDSHDVLCAVVEQCVIPILDQRVRAYRIGTVHNPIRVSHVDDVEVNVYLPGRQQLITPEYVDVPCDTIIEIANSLKKELDNE